MKVVHCRKSEYDTYIGRGSKWGNPFVIGKDGNREQVVEKYAVWILTQPKLIASLGELRDRTIACWCDPQLCHGHILRALEGIGRQMDYDIDYIKNVVYNEDDQLYMSKPLYKTIVALYHRISQDG